MLPLEAFMKQRINMQTCKERAEDWRKTVSASIGQLLTGDCFAQLDSLKAVAYSLANLKAILCVTGGRMRHFIPFHSSHFVLLQARLHPIIFSRQPGGIFMPCRAAILVLGLRG